MLQHGNSPRRFPAVSLRGYQLLLILIRCSLTLVYAYRPSTDVDNYMPSWAVLNPVEEGDNANLNRQARGDPAQTRQTELGITNERERQPGVEPSSTNFVNDADVDHHRIYREAYTIGKHQQHSQHHQPDLEQGEKQGEKDEQGEEDEKEDSVNQQGSVQYNSEGTPEKLRNQEGEHDIPAGSGSGKGKSKLPKNKKGGSTRSKRGRNTEVANATCDDLVSDILKKDETKFQSDLNNLDTELCDVNSPIDVDKRDNGPTWIKGSTLLSLTTWVGWLHGAKILIDWAHNNRLIENGLNVDLKSTSRGASKCSGETALMVAIAVEIDDTTLIEYLIGEGAEPLIQNACRSTPLEQAVQRGLVSATRILLNTKELHNGLASLTRSFRATTRKERIMLTRAALRPMQDSAHMSEDPRQWVLLYKTRVMAIAASHSAQKGGHKIIDMLAENNFSEFTRMYHITLMTACTILFFVFVLVLVVSRIKTYGGLNAPVSLVEFLPGAFAPTRLVDPDFDPSIIMKTKVPYIKIKMKHIQTEMRLGIILQHAAMALVGTYSSWSLLIVRIPPEKDALDEDYESGDDDKLREDKRMRAATKATRLYLIEISVRVVVFVSLIVWLSCANSPRVIDLLTVVFVYVVHSLYSGIIASRTKWTGIESGSSTDSFDSASVVWGLFGVQHGPRWTRCLTSTRCTAKGANPVRTHSTKSTRRKRVVTNMTTEEHFNMDAVISLRAGEAKLETFLEEDEDEDENDRTAHYSDFFHRGFLQSGHLHLTHSDILFPMVVNIFVIYHNMMWLTYFNPWTDAAFSQYYKGTTVPWLFAVYGFPGSFHRLVAILFELVFLWFCCERLYALAMVPIVAAATFRQRERALKFLRAHPPPPIIQKNNMDLQQALMNLGEFNKCSCIATELSSLRWNFLALPVSCIVVLTSGLYLIALGLICASLIGKFRTPLIAVAVHLANTFIFPLGYMLWHAGLTNTNLRLLHASLVQNAVNVLAESNRTGASKSGTLYVNLRGQSNAALSSSLLRWPNGKEIRVSDLGLLLLIAFFANLFGFL